MGNRRIVAPESEIGWVELGRTLRVVDPERYAQIVEVAQAIVNAHLGLTQSVDEAVPMFVDVDSSADLC